MTRPPFLSIGRRQIRRFLRLPGRQRLDLVRALLWLPAVDLGLRTVGFARVRLALARLGRPHGARSPGDPEEAEALGRVVAAAARHHLYPIRCLARSLVLHTLLARRGIGSELRIGVQTDEDGLRAHAWVEHRGRPLAESGDPAESFAALGLE